MRIVAAAEGLLIDLSWASSEGPFPLVVQPYVSTVRSALERVDDRGRQEEYVAPPPLQILSVV